MFINLGTPIIAKFKFSSSLACHPAMRDLCYPLKDNLRSVMTLSQCAVELQNAQVSDTAGVDSSNGGDYIIINLF
jgi:hypothetical protein